MGCRLAVWAVDLDRTRRLLEHWEQENRILTEPEIAFDDVRRRTTRTALRCALWAFGGEEAARQSFTAGAHGRPQLADRSGPAFSVSHSGGWAVIALADHDPLGVDIEAPRAVALTQERRRRITGLARAAGLSGLQTEAQGEISDDEFLTIWTQLEAVGKARGDGVMATLGALHDLQSSPAKSPLSVLISDPCQVEVLSVAEGHHGALVRPAASGAVEVLPFPTSAQALAAMLV